MALQNKIHVLSGSENYEESRRLVLPDLYDVMMAMIFGWALFCLSLVAGGRVVTKLISKLAKQQVLRDAIKNSDETLYSYLMVGGSLAIIVVVLLFYSYRKAVFPLLIFSTTFGDAVWQPLHDFAMAVKYSLFLFILSVSGLFLLKNFWRLISLPYTRVMMLLLFWIVAISLLIGRRPEDFWYMSTCLMFMIGVPLAWNYIDDAESLLKFNRMVAWTGVAITFFHVLAPFVIDKYITSGRFHSYSEKATGFAVIYVLVVVAMFWMGLAEKNKLLKWMFQLVALVGVGLILWSGSRGPTGALIVAIGLLWWIFRTPILLNVLLFTMIGLIIQIVGLSEQESFGLIAERMEGTVETKETRLRIWEGYFKLIFQSPIYGYSVSGLMSAFYSDEQLASFGTDRYVVSYAAAHNSYVGLAARFGFVATGIFCGLIFMSLRRAKTVLLSKFVPEEQKRIYVLPVAMLLILCITCLTEDTVPGNGKGNTPTLMMFMLMYLCEFVGRKLLHQYPDCELEENDEIYQQSTASPEANSSGTLIAQRKRGYQKTSR
jgi:hypothetical protein